MDIPQWAELLLVILGAGGGAGGLSIYGVRRSESLLLDKLSMKIEEIIMPKVNSLCVRTSRMEIADSFIINALEHNGNPGIRDDICDEIDRLGIPRQDSPIKLQ